MHLARRSQLVFLKRFFDSNPTTEDVFVQDSNRSIAQEIRLDQKEKTERVRKGKEAGLRNMVSPLVMADSSRVAYSETQLKIGCIRFLNSYIPNFSPMFERRVLE